MLPINPSKINFEAVKKECSAFYFTIYTGLIKDIDFHIILKPVKSIWDSSSGNKNIRKESGIGGG